MENAFLSNYRDSSVGNIDRIELVIGRELERDRRRRCVDIYYGKVEKDRLLINR